MAIRSTRGGMAVALLAAIALVLAACKPAPPPPPSKDAFYQQSTSLAGTTPGQVLRSRPATFTLDPLTRSAKAGVRSWQVVYRSTSATGAPMAVSGTVLVPDAPWAGGGDRPVVSWGVGTRGLGDDCAPSWTMTQGTDYEGIFIADALDRGLAVVVSDYQGLGTPGPHTYMVGQSQGRAALDAVRAAQQLSGAGLSTSAPVGIAGYSQGGSSAAWAAQLAATYAPELNVRGVVAGGVPADLGATAEFLDGTAFTAFALMAALGLDGAYADLDLDAYLNERGEQLKANASDVCIVSVDGFATFLDTAFSSIDDYVTTNPIGTPTWQTRLGQQRLGGTVPTMPVYQYHAQLDEVVPLAPAEALRDTWCAAGVQLTWSQVPLTEHLSGMAAGIPGGIDWLEDRLAGQPAGTTC